MDESVSIRLPRSLRDGLIRRGVRPDTLRAAVCADMTRDGALRSTYLLLEDTRLLFALTAPAEERELSGASLHRRHSKRTGRRRSGEVSEEIAEMYEYPLHRVSEPRIYNQVVGGLFVVNLDGVETWLCRFSGTKIREMRRFCALLDCRIKGKEPPPELEEDTRSCPKCGQLYPERGRSVCPKCMVKREVFFRVLSYFRDYRLRMGILLATMLLTGGLSAIAPYLTGTVLYDQVLARDDGLAERLGIYHFGVILLLLVLSSMAIELIQQLFGVIRGRMVAFMVPGVVWKIKNDVFAALQKLSIGFFSRRQTGSLMQRVNSDANEVMAFFIDGLPYLVYNLLTFVFAGAVMFAMDWRLALLALFMLPPLFFISYRLLPNLWHAHGRRSRMVRSLYSLLNDGIGGARVVKAFGQEDYENRRFSVVNDRVRSAEMQVMYSNNRFDIAYGLVREIPVLLVWSLGAVFILRSPGAFTYGMLITFINYLNMMQGPMQFFSQIFRWWTSSMNAAQRVFEIVDAHPDVMESENPREADLKGDVTLNNVCFGYEPNRLVLKDVSFSIKAGEMLGIVGKSGAGKSTLVNLISRLYDPESGEILLDGIHAKDLSFSSLRGAVAMVSQETYIFMGTVAENIAYANPEAKRSEIVRAAIAAGAHAFVCRLPDGYDTMIGTGGRELSGGERQRLSIARAILSNPRILVLDEATASVDTQTERAIQASLEKLVQGRTTISIAHRLSTLRGADRLIVLDKGELVESGTHAQLMEKRGVYYKLLQLQTKALAMRGID